MSHRYSSSADIPGHTRTWSPSANPSAKNERSTTTPGQRPMPPQLSASGSSTPVTHSPAHGPAHGQQRQYRTYSPRPRVSREGFESPSRAGGAQAEILDKNVPDPVSPAYRGYNPQDYAQVDGSSKYKPETHYHTPEYSSTTYLSLIHI